MRPAIIVGILAVAGCVRIPPPNPPPGPGAPVRLCNDTGSGLNIGVNWQAPQQVPANRCVGVRAEPGTTLIRAFVVAQPPERLRHPAARMDLPPSGAVVRYGTKNGFIQLMTVKGPRKWARCNYPGTVGQGSQPPKRADNTLWRMELERWMKVNLICGPNV